jgi:hypothetical protein
MNKSFNAVLTVLILATFIYAITLAYVIGFERGVNSQRPIIEQLNRELHPDLRISFIPYLHPMRNLLFGTGAILALCWTFVLLSILWRRLSNPDKS